MELKQLSLKDKCLFDKFLGFAPHELSVYAFQDIYIWKGLFDISWKIIEDNLCVFFKDKIGCFLYLAPLGKQTFPEVVRKCFKIMDKFNRNKNISRIENIEEKDAPFYRDLGYACRYKSCDYVCKRADLAQLKGNKFKSKRSAFNYFSKHYQFAYLPFSTQYRDDCLKLYNLWSSQRKSRSKDSIYQGMLEDNLSCLKIIMKDYPDLGLTGRVVKIGRDIRAFTFGFKLNKNTFCILYETTNLSIKGLSQFIFRQFSKELEGYRDINIMDDSGLENLKRAKLSYHPVRLIPSYIVTRKNG